MMLSNFIRRNGKRKGTKNAKTHEPIRRQQSPTSPASFVSPEILDINEKSLEHHAREDSGSDASRSTLDYPTHPSRNNVGSPLVHLNFSTDPLEDWFPQELLRGKHSSRGSGGSRGIATASQSNLTQESVQHSVQYSSSSGSSSKPTVNLPNVEEAERKSEISINPAEGSPPRPLQGVSTWKKSIPAPIMIPDMDPLAPNVQIGHSAATTEAPPPEAPEPLAKDALLKAPPSPASTEDLSAVSGTTLARALIANSFILSSSEHRTSRHRSGIARQDSATLPRGEHPLINSPYWRDKRISGGEVVFTPESGRTSPVPPVPPMPAGAVVEQKRVQRSSSLKSQGMSSSELRSHSAASTASEYPLSDAYATSPEPIMHSNLSRRISRIAEVPSPAPTTPGTPASTLALETRPQQSKSSVAIGSILGKMAGSEESDLPNTASEIPSSADSRPAEEKPSEESSHTEPFSPSPTDHSLDEYQFVPPGPHTAAISSPGSDSSASYIAPLPTKRGDSSSGRRRFKAGGGGISLTGGRSRIEFNRNVSDARGNASYQRNKKQVKLLPIGDPSLLVPHTPITPALIASSIVAPYSSLSQFPLVPSSAVPAGHLEMPPTARDNLDLFMTAAATAGIFDSRQRSDGPEPISVDQDYSELLNYAITVSPDYSSSSHYTPTSTSAGYQTFPETPMVFSPLWSPDFSRPPGSAARFPNERPQVPSSATLPKPRELGKGLLSRAMTTVSRPARKEDEAGEGSSVPRRPLSAVSPIQVPSPQPSTSSTSSSAEAEVAQQSVSSDPPDVPDEVSLPSPQKAEEPVQAVDPMPATEPIKPNFRPHPLAHISTSSSKLLEEEALQSFALNSASSIPSIITSSEDPSSTPLTSPPLPTETYCISPTSVPLPESTNTSPLILPASAGSITTTASTSADNTSSHLPPPSQAGSPRSSPNISQPTSKPMKPSRPSRPISLSPLPGSSFLPSVSPTSSVPVSPVDAPPRRSSPSPPLVSSPSPGPSPPSPTPSVSLSFVAPPPYHTVVSERTAHHPLNSRGSPRSLSRAPSSELSHERDRQPSLTASPGQSSRSRVRARPPLPIGPRKPSGPAQPLAFVPGIRGRGDSVSSVSSSNHGGASSSSPWRKLYAAASKPPPKFQSPPPKWRGLTMEAAQWTFTSHQLQSIVSRAIKQSAEGSSIRLLRLETLDGEIAEETHRLEMLRTDVKSRYKALVRKRWNLMGALAGHIEGAEMNDTATAIRTMEELAEVSLALDQLSDELHGIVEQLAQLRSLRDVHTGSALAMALRKVNSTFLKQVAETQKLREQIQVLEAERDEAWKHAEDVAQDYDELNDRIGEPSGEGQADETRSTMSSRRSIRVSAVRKASIRQSKAGLRTVGRYRSRRSSVSSVGTRASMTFPPSNAEDVPPVPPVPPLPLHQLGSVSALPSGLSSYNSGASGAQALAQAQQELYEMLGLHVQDTPSEISSRPRTISGPYNLKHGSLNLRPMSEGGTGGSLRPRSHENRAVHSVILDDRQAMLATLGMMSN